MDINSPRRDYHKYSWEKGERVRGIALCAGLTGILAFFFYRSLLAAVPLSAAGVYAFGQMGRKKAEQAREELSAQFRECILAVATSLQAGYSAENAFLECRQDMGMLYGENALICRELGFIARGLGINIPLEELLEDVAARSCSEDIALFVQIFALAKRSGGNMAEIIRNSADRIGRRIELRQEGKSLLGGRQMELGIMKGMPFGILLYISLGSQGYFDALYHNLAGAAVMTGCLGAYLAACLMGEYILRSIVAGS